MGRKSKQKKRARKRQQASAPPIPRTDPKALETPASVATTVAWLLSAFATTVALIAALVTRLFFLRSRDPDTLTLVQLFLFAAMATGFVTLILTPLAQRVRRVPAPRNIVIGASAIGLLPMVVQATQTILGHP